jgi:hypothetical protein
MFHGSQTSYYYYLYFGDRHGHGHMDLQLLMQSVPIPTNVSSNLAHGEVHLIQFLLILGCPQPIKLD